MSDSPVLLCLSLSVAVQSSAPLMQSSAQSTRLTVQPTRQSLLPHSQSPSSRSTSPQSKRRKKKDTVDNLDRLLVSQIDHLTAERDEASSFGEHVASRLKGFTPRERALACLEIDKVLLNIEFPNDIPFSSPHNVPYAPNISSPHFQSPAESPVAHNHTHLNSNPYQNK